MVVRCHMPSFGYAVTRQYPYKWFSWVVLIGGVIALILFSAINFGANGYELKVQYTTDLNSTVSQAQWAERWPFSWFSKVETTCQSQTLQINSQFFTDKLSLPYTLTGVWQNRTASNTTVVPSLRYTNNVLNNCTVNEMVINLESTSRTANELSIYSWGPEASAYITCSVNNDDTPTWFNLTTNYDYITPGLTANPGSKGASFLQLDNTTKASLWSWYYIHLADATASQTLLSYPDGSTENLVKGTFRTEPYPEGPPSHISSPLFFHDVTKIRCVANYSGTLSGEYGCSDMDNTVSNYLDYWPFIYPQADQYAKVFYSAILADLGSSSLDNILVNASLLQEYSHDFSTDIYDWDGPAFQSYNELKDVTGPLKITPSTIYAEYLCQVPQRKPMGPLLVAIFVADLVFLQALWNILTWITTAWTERNYSEAKFCEGCLAAMARGTYELSLTAPTDAAQGSSHALSETSISPALGSRRGRHRSSESQQPLVLSPGFSEPG